MSSSEEVLRNAMVDLSESFIGFRLAPGEMVELVLTPHLDTNPEVVIVRYEEVRDAWALPRAYGSSCEFFVILADTGGKFPTPVDPTRLLASWRRRERQKDEIGLSRPIGRLKVLPFDEPSLEFRNVYPAGENHVCEARFYFHQSRYDLSSKE